MPRIPTYQPGRVVNSPIPGPSITPQASAASFGGADAQGLGSIGEGLQRAGNVTASIGVSELDRENTDIVRGQMNTAREKLNEFTQKEYSLKGRDAFGSTDRIRAFSQKLNDEYANGFDNDAQKEMFTDVFGTHVSSHVMQAQGFEQGQRDAYHGQTLDAENSIALSEIRGGDFKSVETGLEEISRNTLAKHSGDGNAISYVKAARRGSLMEIIKKQGSVDPEGAIGLIQAYGDELGGSADSLRNGYRKDIEDKDDANRLIGLTSQPGATLQTVLAQIDGMNVPAEKKQNLILAATTQMSIRGNAEAQAQKAQREGEYRNMWSMKESGKDAVSWVVANVKDATQKTRMLEDLHDSTKKIDEKEQGENYAKLLRRPFIERMNYPMEERGEVDFGRKAVQDWREDKAHWFKTGMAKNPVVTKAVEDAAKEAGQLSQFRIETGDSDAKKMTKQKAYNQFVFALNQRMSQIPPEKSTNPTVIDEVKKQLLKDEVLQKTSSDWIPWNEKSEPAFVTESNALEAGGASAQPSIQVPAGLAVPENTTAKPTEQPVAASGAESRVVPKPTIERPAVQSVDDQIMGKIGVKKPITVTGSDIVKSADQVRSDIEQSALSVVKIPGYLGKGAAKYGGKVYDATLGKVSDAVALDLANAFPTSLELTDAKEMYLDMQNASVDTSVIDDIYKKMNGIAIADASAPGGRTLGGRNTPREFIKAVNEAYESNAGKVANMRGRNAPPVIVTQDQADGVKSGQIAIVNGKRYQKP